MRARRWRWSCRRPPRALRCCRSPRRRRSRRCCWMWSCPCRWWVLLLGIAGWWCALGWCQDGVMGLRHVLPKHAAAVSAAAATDPANRPCTPPAGRGVAGAVPWHLLAALRLPPAAGRPGHHHLALAPQRWVGGTGWPAAGGAAMPAQPRLHRPPSMHRAGRPCADETRRRVLRYTTPLKNPLGPRQARNTGP